ncbi:MAG: DUF2752 domain-containing protein [Phycisphaerales bacterium]
MDSPATPDPRLTWQGRFIASVIAACCLTVLILAARLNPNPDGMGTHRQLGLPPCGWVVMFGRPCMTCGMTTAFSHAAHLQPWAAIKTQPLGALLAFMTPVGFAATLHAALTGARLDKIILPMLKPKLLWLAGAALIAAWVYKLVVTPVV